MNEQVVALDPCDGLSIYNDLEPELVEILNADHSIPRLKGWLSSLADHLTVPDYWWWRVPEGGYHRFYLGRHSLGTEVLALLWKTGAATNIHGHPALAFYQVVSGEFEMTFYRRTPYGGVEPDRSRSLFAGDRCHSQGEANRYDNLIHQVKCKNSGVTLHLYSEDARKGEIFKET